MEIEGKSRENSGARIRSFPTENISPRVMSGQKERKGGKRTTSRSFYDASFSFKVLLTVRKLHLFDCSNAKNRNS